MPLAWSCVSLMNILNGSNSLEPDPDKDSSGGSKTNSLASEAPILTAWVIDQSSTCLGQYRMPLAWNCVSLMNILNGSNSLERDPDKDSIGGSNTNSLGKRPIVYLPWEMPLAWSRVSLMNILNGSNSLERDPDKDSIGGSNTNSLDRKASSSSLEQLRRRAGEVGGSLTRKGSIERRSVPTQAADEVANQLDSFKPIVITVTSFFKQETDKLRDEDLYKFLAEIKRPSSSKKMKCIPGTLKIEVCPCPEEIRNGLTPELAKLVPYADDNLRPCKEILPFPIHPPIVPHYQYRNLLFVNVKEINLNAYTSRTGSARNITVRIQLMSGEDQSLALPAIFGRSSCPEFATEAYTTVLYHNKNPSLYDEIKLKLPADLGDQHHLLFTFLHVSCQRKPVAPDQEKNVETVVGYSWLPLCRNNKLTCGEFSLPVMTEEPPANYSYIFPDVLLPGTRWIDNHKPIFTLSLDPHTTVHPLDGYIERFAMACEAVQEGNIPPRIGLANMEAELRASISELPTANVETLARYLPVVADKLLYLLVAPPTLAGQTLNVSQDVFTCLAHVFAEITNMNEGATCDPHGRSSLISTYIQYQCTIPRPSLTDRDIGLPLPPTASTKKDLYSLRERESERESGRDSERESMREKERESERESSERESGRESGKENERDSKRVRERDSTLKSGRESGRENERESKMVRERESRWESGRENERESMRVRERESRWESGRESGRENERESKRVRDRESGKENERDSKRVRERESTLKSGRESGRENERESKRVRERESRW
ncbi:hypothetical protein NE865_14281 [Phthorimaea operculella]|nr:hypothetical protein NE865_14281 [Phthorimaea operculella]